MDQHFDEAWGNFGVVIGCLIGCFIPEAVASRIVRRVQASASPFFPNQYSSMTGRAIMSGDLHHCNCGHDALGQGLSRSCFNTSSSTKCVKKTNAICLKAAGGSWAVCRCLG